MMVINAVHDFSPKIYKFQNKVDNAYFIQTKKLFQNFENDTLLWEGSDLTDQWS